jgi:hypothetical protein
MSDFKQTNEWIRKTCENKTEEQLYVTKLANKESTSMFNVIKRPRCGKQLIPSHTIDKYDQTMFTFITETSEMFNVLKNRIVELEEKLAKLENK